MNTIIIVTNSRFSCIQIILFLIVGFMNKIIDTF